MVMEEVVCTIQPMKLVTMDHETVSGCGVVDILFPSVAGTKVYGCFVLKIQVIDYLQNSQSSPVVIKKIFKLFAVSEKT